MSTDVRSIFDDYHIPYKDFGKNTSQGWINTGCIYCQDSSNHLGVNLESGAYSCWRCGSKGKLSNLLRDVLEISSSEAEDIIREHEDFLLVADERSQVCEHDKAVALPTEATKELCDIHVSYLESRNIEDIKGLTDKFGLRYTLHAVSLPYRIIIPVYEDGILVTYSSRDCLGSSQARYKALSKKESIKDISECLYGCDLITRDCEVVLVEGPADVWRMSEALPEVPALGLFGSSITQAQISVLLGISHRISKVWVMLDGGVDMKQKAREIADQISAFGIASCIVFLDEGEDPSSITDIRALRGLYGV